MEERQVHLLRVCPGGPDGDGTLSVISSDRRISDEIQNARTNRKVKTLIPIESITRLNELELEYGLIRKNLGRIKSNSVCLYATDDHKPYEYELREVPENWRDWEETASALAFGVLLNGAVYDPNQMLNIRQRLDEDRHREINLKFRTWGSSVNGLWIGGTAEFETEKRETGKSKNWETDPE